MKAIEQYFHVVLFIMLHTLILIFVKVRISVCSIINPSEWHDSCQAVISKGTACVFQCLSFGKLKRRIALIVNKFSKGVNGYWSFLFVPCEQLVSPTPHEREITANNRLLFHRACASSSRPTWYIWRHFHLSIYFSLAVFVQKNENFSPRALTKERPIPSSKYCIYLVCGLLIKPKFKAFLPCLVWVCWACWTQHSRPSSKQQLETIQSTAGLQELLQATGRHQNYKQKRAQSTRGRISAMYSMQSRRITKRLSTSIVTQTSAVDLGLSSLHSGLA